MTSPLRTMRHGFTLPELLLAVFVISLLGTAAAVFQRDVFSYNSTLQLSLGAQQEARRSLKSMSQEVRSASPSSAGAFPLANVGATDLVFFSDFDNDGAKERVHYFMNGTTLMRGVIEPTGNPATYNPLSEVASPLIQDVSNGAGPLFQYFDAAFDGTTAPLTQPVNPSAVRLVRITVIIDRIPNRPPGPITLSIEASLRNLKDNL